MGLFQHRVGEQAILSEGGIERQVDLYERDGYLYGKVGSGYVRLNVDGSTAKPKLRLVFLDVLDVIRRDPMGRLCTSAKADSLRLEAPKAAALGLEVKP